MVEGAVVVEQPEQQRPDVRARPVLVPAEAGDDAVGRALVLDLEHRPLAGLVRARRAASRSTPSSPAPSNRSNQSAASARSVVAGVRWTGGCDRRRAPPRGGRAARPAARARRSSSPSASRSQATNDAGDSSASIFTRDAAGWMRSSSASNSSAPSRAMTTSPSRTQRSGSAARSGVGELREVAIERLEVAGLDVDLVAVAEDDRPEAVPLRLEQPAVAGREAVGRASRASARAGGSKGSCIGRVYPAGLGTGDRWPASGRRRGGQSDPRDAEDTRHAHHPTCRSASRSLLVRPHRTSSPR